MKHDCTYDNCNYGNHSYMGATVRQHKAEAETVRKGYPHNKRNKSGHTFKPDGSGYLLPDDETGLAQICSCGLTLYSWRCKWLWS